MTNPPAYVLSIPYASCIGVKSILVGWCPSCKTVCDPWPGPGIRCDGDHDEMSWEYKHRWHKRLMWKCPGIANDSCDFYFLTYRGLLEHEHGFV